MKLPPGYVAGVGVHKASGFGGFGQRMLERMGWNKGQGLGKDKSGMTEALDVKEKKDVLGVSARTPASPPPPRASPPRHRGARVAQWEPGAVHA